MAKKTSGLAYDFQQVNKASAENVLEYLQHRTSADQVEKTQYDATQIITETKAAKPRAHSQTKPTRQNTKPRNVTTKTKDVGPNPVQSDLPEWGRPTALLNTRIPEKMAEILDDLVYKLRKKGTRRTKQDLVRQAMQKLLSEHKML